MKKRIAWVVGIFAMVALVGFLYYVLFRYFGFGIPCIFHQITGLSCPGCGLTRAFVAILSRGDFALALSYNAMLPLYVAYGLWYVGTVTVRYIKGEDEVVQTGPAWVHILMLVLIVVFGIVRNII